jgi:hypothetical protein
LRARAKATFPGLDFNFNMESALAAGEEKRQREFETRWAYGGLPFLGAFGDRLYDQASNDLGSRVCPQKDPRDCARPRRSRAAFAEERLRPQATLRRYRLLGNLEPT